MKQEIRERRLKAALYTLRRFCLFFMSTSFVITCCMLLFLTRTQGAMGQALPRTGIEQAAKLTFVNVILLSLLFTALDRVYRKLTTERAVRQIVQAAERIIQGDLNARVPPLRGLDHAGGLDIIADYFNRMAEELSGNETLRTDFIANVSHELKTPLAVIQNYSTMLQRPGLPEAQRLEYSRAITDASRRLTNLITNILKLNKLENQQIYPAKEVYDLGEQLCECLLGFENTWEAKNLDICTDLEEAVLVETDRELLELVWNNLFSNAVKFTPPNGRITLRLRTGGAHAIVQVSDTGCGIRPEVGVHIFEKFYQGDTSHAAQGNGLGLALVKRVVDIVGGSISVESEVDKGSTFTVSVERKHDETTQTNPE